MDIQAVYQIIYTVLFVLAGVFFVAAIFVFFQFKILDVFEDLSGVKIRKRPGKATGTQPSKRRLVKAGGKKAVTQPETGTAPISQMPSAESGSNTVWLDERQTVNLDESKTEDPATEICKTADMTATAGLTGAATVSLAGANEDARAALDFRPGAKIIVTQSMERI